MAGRLGLDHALCLSVPMTSYPVMTHYDRAIAYRSSERVPTVSSSERRDGYESKTF